MLRCGCLLLLLAIIAVLLLVLAGISDTPTPAARKNVEPLNEWPIPEQ